MTKIEQVARALADRVNTDQEFNYQDLALAAIAAMREPTEAMYTAGSAAFTECREQFSDAIWHAMIDAVMKEPP